jgi:hypothetical protein
VYSDAVRLYRAGKASGWHAGVLLAAPTIHAEVCSHVGLNSKFNLIIDVTYFSLLHAGWPSVSHSDFGRNDFAFFHGDDDNGQWTICHCGGIFLNFSTKQRATLCAIG